MLMFAHEPESRDMDVQAEARSRKNNSRVGGSQSSSWVIRGSIASKMRVVRRNQRERLLNTSEKVNNADAAMAENK
jgi:hypothetical protein